MVQEFEEPEMRPAALAEVKALLEREQETRGELTYEQKLALEQSLNFARVSPEDARKLFEDLKGLEKLTDAHRWKIVDLAPTHADDVRAIFAKERLALEDADINKIIESVQAYVS